MSLRIDRFTWIVILLVAALLAAAVITVSRDRGQDAAQTSFMTEDDPAAPVYNAFVALQNSDIATAREQYSQRIRDDIAENNYDPFSGRGYMDNQSRRLRIIETKIDDNNSNRAQVSIVVDTYYPGGLFGGGTTSSMQRTIEVIREDGQWKIDTDEFFY
jgi:hypothetical protein